jgi:hypothetical protein
MRQIERCKLGIREALRAAEEAGGDRPIPARKFDADGEIDQTHIFCAKCHGGESFEARHVLCSIWAGPGKALSPRRMHSTDHPPPTALTAGSSGALAGRAGMHVGSLPIKHVFQVLRLQGSRPSGRTVSPWRLFSPPRAGV